MLTIKNILCPVDLSPTSRRALEYATALSAAYQATLRVVEVIDSSMPPIPRGTWLPQPLSADMRQAYLDELRDFIAPAAGRGPGPDAQIVEGVVVTEVLREAERLPANLVVMGTHGRGGFERLVLGSVTEKVLRKAKCPILTVPAGLPPLSGGLTPFPSIICAFDFSRASTHALMYAWSLARDTTGRLTVLHVVEWPQGDAHVGEAPLDVEALPGGLGFDVRRQLHEAMPKGELATGPIEEVVACGKPSLEILRLASEHPTGLIVLGVHGRGVVDLALFGSTTHRVIREARCPVLTVRSPD